MPLHVIICGLIALVILFAWGALEFLFENRRLRASAPPRLPFGAPTMEERMQAIEAWRREMAERAAKEQVEEPKQREEKRQQQISFTRAHLLAAREIARTLDGAHDAGERIQLAQARAQIAASSEQLRFLGVEA